jgi:uncharacterized membrane protein
MTGNMAENRTSIMGTGRLEAFSDGVIAIIITVMVLELKMPQGTDLSALLPVLSPLMSYALSFIYVGIYWNNHHHTLRAANHVNGGILWANLYLLFWLSLVPFATDWMGQTGFAAVPSALYGVVLMMAGLAYLLLQRAILAADGPDSVLAKAVGRDFKGKISAVIYAASIPVALFVSPMLTQALFVLVALMWLVPDRRIEKALAEAEPEKSP